MLTTIGHAMNVQKALGSRGWLAIPLVTALVVLCVAALVWWSPWSTGADAVTTRASLDDYSWDELAAIARELSSCDNEADAIAHAAAYGLCQTDGTLDGSQTKEVALADGTKARVALAGVWHDDKTDGDRAGLTFAFVDAAGTHAMNHAFEDANGTSADSRGGWSASDMRAWLNETFFLQLPLDLRGRIASVQKRTANSASTTAESFEAGRLAGSSADWVTQTSDKVWLFSASEVCGAVPANEDLGVDETMSAVYAGEGAQYPLFASCNATAFEPCDGLVRTFAGDATTWWLRTQTLEFGDGFWLVGTDGTPLNGLGEDARVVVDPSFAPDELWGPDHARGVVIGFCL